MGRIRPASFMDTTAIAVEAMPGANEPFGKLTYTSPDIVIRNRDFSGPDGMRKFKRSLKTAEKKLAAKAES